MKRFRPSSLLTSSIFILAAFATVAGGCSLPLTPRPDHSKFFVLSPIAAPAAAASPLTIGLGPITIPEYLQRQEIVTRVAPNRLLLSSNDRWAQGLESNFTQVLAQDLTATLGTTRITTYPWYRTTQIDFQIKVAVYRFEANSKGTVNLTAHWEILDGSGKLLYATDSTFTAAASSGNTTAVVAAMSAAEADLARAITAEIQSLPPAAK